jgi:hypothetical protein
MRELLTGNLPESFLIDGKEYKISSDFREIVALEEILSSEDLTDAERGEQALNLFYGCIPSDVEAAVDKLCWFMQCGEKERPHRGRRQGTQGDFRQSAVYSFIHDAGLIYAAFMAQYGVDLCDVEYLHWWKFKAMFEGLEDSRVIKEVMRCRAVEIDSKMPQGQKDYYNAMKQRYALPLPEGVEKQMSDLEAALMGDGNVSEVIRCNSKK